MNTTLRQLYCNLQNFKVDQTVVVKGVYAKYILRFYPNCKVLK